MIHASEAPELEIARCERGAGEVQSELHRELHRALERRGEGDPPLRWPSSLPPDIGRWLHPQIETAGIELEILDREAVRTDFPTPGGRSLPLWEVRLQARGRGTLDQIVELLKSLERGEVSMHVPGLLIEKEPDRPRGDELLTVTMVLVAFGSLEETRPPGELPPAPLGG